MHYLSSHVIAFAVTLTLLRVLMPLARRIDLVDCPGGRKCHDGPVPLIGGIAMFWGFLFAVLTLDVSLAPLRALFAGSALLVLVGVLDDFHELSSRTRFIGQIMAALAMIYWGGVRLGHLGHLVSSGLFTLRPWEAPVTAFATVGVINALNMADGLDGLAGSLALIALGTMAALALAAGHLAEAQVLLVLASAVAAFLCLNLRFAGRPRALVFMGDAGSMFLGFAIAWFSIGLSQGDAPAMTPVTALWIFALPLFDTVSIMLRRVLKGRSPFAADREHFHHILQAAGYSVNESVLIMTSLALGLAAVGVAGFHMRIPESVMFLGLMMLFAAYFWSVLHAWKVMKALRHHSERPAGVRDLVAGTEARGPSGG